MSQRGRGLTGDLAARAAAGKLLAGRTEPHLARALQALQLREAPGSNAVGADRHWRLYADPARCADWTPQQWAAVMRAEARRLLLDHPGRAQQQKIAESQQPRWAHASDAVVYADTERSAQAQWPDNLALTRLTDLPGGHLGMAVEEVYRLLEIQDIEPPAAPGWGGASLGCDQPWEQPEPDSDAQTLSEIESQMLCRSVAQAVSDAAESGQEISPVMREWAVALINPQIDWRRALDAAVRAATGKAAGRRDYTYSRPSRRQAAGAGATGVILPGMYAPEPPRVAVVRDTSGSMTDLLEAASAEIEGMLDARARVTLIDTDEEVAAARKLRRGQASQVSGGGGTDMRVGIEAALRQRPMPHLVVVLTDGMTEWPKLPTRVPMLVVLLGRQAERYADQVPGWASVLLIPSLD